MQIKINYGACTICNLTKMILTTLLRSVYDAIIEMLFKTECNDNNINPLSAEHILMKFPIFGLSASVDIRSLPGAWVAELLGVLLEFYRQLKG